MKKRNRYVALFAGKNREQDLESVADYAVGREYADRNNIVVMGCSQGGRGGIQLPQ